MTHITPRTEAIGLIRRANHFGAAGQHDLAGSLWDEAAEIAREAEVISAVAIIDFEVIIDRGHVRDAYNLARDIARDLEPYGFRAPDEWTIEASEYTSEFPRVFAAKDEFEMDPETYARFRREFLCVDYDDHGEPTMGMLGSYGHLPAVSYRFDEGYDTMSYQASRYLITSCYVSEGIAR